MTVVEGRLVLSIDKITLTAKPGDEVFIPPRAKHTVRTNLSTRTAVLGRMDCNTSKSLDEIAALLRRSRRVLFITGAGISADSGLPTYRGIGGLYERDLTEEGVPIESALSGTMMRKRPEITWKYLRQIEASCREARFNRGHEVIALLQERIAQVWVLTQNIDGFHRQAGSRNVIPIHGDIHHLRCIRCPARQTVIDFSALPALPTCSECGGLIRPEVVLFGEVLPRDQVDTLERELASGFDLVFSIGTTSLFPYIALPVIDASENGTPTVEINPHRSEISRIFDYRLRSRAAETLDALWRRLEGTDLQPRPQHG